MRISVFCLVLVGAAQALVTRSVLAQETQEKSVEVTIGDVTQLEVSIPGNKIGKVKITSNDSNPTDVTCQRFDMEGKRKVDGKAIVLSGLKSGVANDIDPMDTRLSDSNESPFQIHCNV